MPLNIKSPEAHDLARQLSRVTGESLTQAVTAALRERLARVEAPDALVAELLAIGRDCAGHLAPPWSQIDHAELLYDDEGLPK